MNSRITKENMLFTLPFALQRDTSTEALAAATAEVLENRQAEIDRLRIISNIDNLEEALLTILAYDFKVDWWDDDCSLEEKRQTLKDSWRVHKLLGTKAAVVTAISAIYPHTRVLEWFEYGGEPYHFRLDVDLPEDAWTQERHRRLMWQLQYYKNLRSHLDSVVYRLPAVVLENRQAFWMAALHVCAKFEQENYVGLHRLLLNIGARQEFGSALGLVVGGAVRESDELALERLLIRARVNNYGLNPIRLNGKRRLDGSWRLNQGMAPGLALRRVMVQVGTVNRQTASAAVTADTMWRLDGKHRLNGKKKLNAAIKRSEL